MNRPQSRNPSLLGWPAQWRSFAPNFLTRLCPLSALLRNGGCLHQGLDLAHDLAVDTGSIPALKSRAHLQVVQQLQTVAELAQIEWVAVSDGVGEIVARRTLDQQRARVR